MKSWLAAVALSAALAPSPGAAQPAATSPGSAEPPLATRLSLKSSALVTRAPDAPWLFPDRHAATSFWRIRAESVWRPAARWSVDVAYEHRARLFSSADSPMGGGVLPREAPTPYRLRPLDWTLQAGAHSAWHHEIDRAAVRWQSETLDVTAGRQALGWGRGVLFGALDIFAPFAPLEADREWRRGIDAVRADLKLADRVSIDAVAAFGERPSASVYAARLRGYNTRADVEIMGGWRARDGVAGASTSFAVRGAEVHAEAAVFRTRAAADSTVFGNARTVVKTVAGASYRVPVGAGLFVEAEYHYSAFGAATARDTLALVVDPEFSRRYLRGDTQMLGRHALAALVSYEWSPLVAGAAQWLQNPVDGSGLAAPSLTITPGDRWSLLISAYLPYGPAPTPSAIHSEYGLMPVSLFAQLRLYR